MASWRESVHKPVGTMPYLQFVNENHSYVAHYHEEVEVIFVEKGQITVFSGSRRMDLTEGDICFFMPGEVHTFQSITYNNLYVMKFPVPSAAPEELRLDRRRLKRNVLSPEDSDYPLFRGAIDRIHREYTTRETGYSLAIKAESLHLLTALLRRLPWEPAQPIRSTRLLETVNRYLDERYDAPITLEEAAAACHFSKYYFAHAFKELTGTTFSRYLAAFRLEKAVAALAVSDGNITAVALSCGFGNVRSFNRAFRERFGMTPLQYRHTVQTTPPE